LAVFVLRFLREIVAGAGALLTVLAVLALVVYAIGGGGRALLELGFWAAVGAGLWLYFRHRDKVEMARCATSPHSDDGPA